MHLFETKEGDIWVCVTCRSALDDKIDQDKWEWIFDKDDPTLRCGICGHPDFEIED